MATETSLVGEVKGREPSLCRQNMLTAFRNELFRDPGSDGLIAFARVYIWKKSCSATSTTHAGT